MANEPTEVQIALLKQAVENLTSTVVDLRNDVKSNNATYATKAEVAASNARTDLLEGRLNRLYAGGGFVLLGVLTAVAIALIKVIGPQL